MGDGAGEAAAFRTLISSEIFRTLPVVIDADALNILAGNPELLKQLGPNCVLTPHPGEMARLTGKPIPEIQSRRFESAAELSEKCGCVVVLKGARTVVASPGGFVFVNPAATGVLGTAGSGDSLAGIIGAFMAQGLSPCDAAGAAVFAHGTAGEML